MQFPDFQQQEPETPVSFYFEDVDEFDLGHEEVLADWLMAVAAKEGKPFRELSCIFCSDERLRQIKVEFLRHDYYTDIITFPYADDAVHGDLFISTERVTENAAQLGVSFRQELCRVLVHGVLHLCGFSDKTAEEVAQMRAKENEYLALIP